MSNIRSIVILLVEDDPGHARLIEKNLRRAHIKNEIIVFGDGQQVLDYLHQTLDHPVPFPQTAPLVLLDLNLPILDGYQVLEYMKTDQRTAHIPVIVLTTTDDAREIRRCYELGCNVYLTKPVEYDQFVEAIRRLGFFLSVIKIPDGE